MSREVGRQFVGVMVAAGTAPELRHGVLHGLEEEGVPALLLPPDGDQVALLAQRAASASPLGLGIGLDAAGGGAVWHIGVTTRPYLRTAAPLDPERARLLGCAAGRLAKRRPLPNLAWFFPLNSQRAANRSKQIEHIDTESNYAYNSLKPYLD